MDAGHTTNVKNLIFVFVFWIFRGYSEDGLTGTISPQREKYVGRGDTTGMLTIDLFLAPSSTAEAV